MVGLKASLYFVRIAVVEKAGGWMLLLDGKGRWEIQRFYFQ